MKKNILRPFRKNRKKFYIYFYTNYKIDKISLCNYDIHNPQTISGPLQEYLHTILHNKGTANILFSFPFFHWHARGGLFLACFDCVPRVCGYSHFWVGVSFRVVILTF